MTVWRALIRLDIPQFRTLAMRNSKTLMLTCALAILTAQAHADETITINVIGEFSGLPFSCAQTYQDVGVSGSTVEVADYRLFISDVALVMADGARVPLTLDQDGAWQFGPVALIDFEDGTGACTNGTAETNTTITGTAPADEYTGLAFSVGVPFDLNHGDPTLAASPLNLTAMFWNWRAGYKFVKLDIATAGQPLMTASAKADHDAEQQSTTPQSGDNDSSPRGWSLHMVEPRWS
ncbi:MAG: MbnP family copper-binding protein, partial [Pseudomonadota bacterium]